MIQVLDHGYVKVVDVLGSDLSVVNAARVSFDKEVNEVFPKDERLIAFLVKHHHDSPLRHAAMTFEVYAPLQVKNQWIKHAVASTHLDDQYAWNESSRRYVTETPQYYTPKQFFAAPDDAKQGVGFEYAETDNKELREELRDFYAYADGLYNNYLEMGVAPEQARLFLPAYGLYVRWRWTASLNALLNFLTLRLGEGAQGEMMEYGKAIATQVAEHFPITTDAWMKHRVEL